MLAVKAPRYTALPDPSDLPSRAQHGEAYVLSDFSNSGKSGGYESRVPEYDRASGKPNVEHDQDTPGVSRLAGWRWGAMVAAMSSSAALLLNLGVTIWVGVELRRTTSSVHSQILVLYQGDCGNVERTNTCVHLAINAVSAVLLSASNYCMQCLSAPTRKEVDKAHAERKWLDIGVPSVRNLHAIGKGKLFFWWILGLSSVPLHLLYNSAFFSSISTNDYHIIFAAENFTEGAPFGGGGLKLYLPYVGDSDLSANKTLLAIIGRIQDQAPHWERLTKHDCIDAYATDFVSDRRTVVIVSNNTHSGFENGNSSGSLLNVGGYTFNTVVGASGYDPYSWICSDPSIATKLDIPYYGDNHCDESPAGCCYNFISKLKAQADSWAPEGIPAEYCLSEKIPGSCGYNVNIVVLIVVVVCNFGKVACMLYVAFRIKDDPLMTIGDAIKSFLLRPDRATKAMCLLSRDDIDAPMASFAAVTTEPRPYEPKPLRWRNSASVERWTFFIALFGVAILIVIAFFGVAIGALPARSRTDLRSFGFGAVSPATLITGWSLSRIKNANTAIVAATLIANLPQAILSFLYLALNGIITSMFLAAEWASYSVARKTLRVSKPTRPERRTYFLQLPYRVAVPMIGMSALLHWLVSQSIFLAVISTYNRDGALADATAVVTCGFSPLAMVFCIVVGFVLVCAVIGLGSFRLKGGIPVAGSCSLAIAAACHADGEDVGGPTALKWGEPDGEWVDGAVGHCSFSGGMVRRPTVGRLYAGKINFPDESSRDEDG